MNEEIETVDQIDDMLSKQFAVSETEEEGVSVDDNVNEEDEDQNDDQQTSDDLNPTKTDDEKTEESDDSVDTTEAVSKTNDQTSKKTPKGENKSDYAFGKLRKELNEAKSNAEKFNDFVKSMAEKNGYSDTEEFMSEYSKASLVKEAQDKGLDPELYVKNNNVMRENEALKKRISEFEVRESADKLKSSIDEAIETYKLGEKGKDIIFDRLEKAGLSVDQLLKFPDPELLIRGVLSDKIQEVAKSEYVEKETILDSLADKKHSGSIGSDKKLSLTDLVKSDIESYKKENYFN